MYLWTLSERIKMANTNRKKILIVDDDVRYVEDLKALLSRFYEVWTAHNGEEALEQIHDVKPDLILLDIVMPKMDGLEFFDRITPLNSAPLYPVLIVTQRGNLREYFRNLQVEDFLVKPLMGIEILKKIEVIFEEQSKKPVLNPRDRYKKILIIDNNLGNLALIAHHLLDRGHILSVAKTTEQAIEKIVSVEIPDLVLICAGLSEHPEYLIPYHLRGIPEARNTKVAVYVEDFRTLDMNTEAEITKVVGGANMLELKDLNHFFERCRLILGI